MDQGISWFKIIGVPVVVGHDYHIVINPDADYDFDKPYTLGIDADGDIGYAMDKARSWFRSVEDPVPPGNDYHVLINPDTDFVSDWPMHLFISADSDAGWSLDEVFFWFRVVKAFFGYHVVIDPDVYLEELTISSPPALSVTLTRIHILQKDGVVCGMNHFRTIYTKKSIMNNNLFLLIFLIAAMLMVIPALCY